MKYRDTKNRGFTSMNLEWGYRTLRGFPMTLSSIYKLFTNPFYYGHMESKAGTATGTHQPMITEAEFWRAQYILGRRGKPRPQRHALPTPASSASANAAAWSRPSTR